MYLHCLLRRWEKYIPKSVRDRDYHESIIDCPRININIGSHVMNYRSRSSERDLALKPLPPVPFEFVHADEDDIDGSDDDNTIR